MNRLAVVSLTAEEMEVLGDKFEKYGKATTVSAFFRAALKAGLDPEFKPKGIAALRAENEALKAALAAK